MTDDELLEGLDPAEQALLRAVLEREAAAPQQRPRPYKPTDEELIAAGWKSPPPPPPSEDDLLRMLWRDHRELRPRQWVELLLPIENDILLRLHERVPGLLRHRVTKSWGHGWRLAGL